jgi:hypothetical protein
MNLYSGLHRLSDRLSKPIDSISHVWSAVTGTSAWFIDPIYAIGKTVKGGPNPPQSLEIGSSAILGMLSAARDLTDLLSIPHDTLLRWLHDLEFPVSLDAELRSRWLESTGVALPARRWAVGSLNTVLYLIVRKLQPKTVVETGVEYGFSSSFLLRGLEDNDLGRLISIDEPTLDPLGRVNADGRRDPAHVDHETSTGKVIPDRLRHRWNLARGRSNPVLREVLDKYGPIDVFFHDSEHSIQNMLWEFRTAWPKISPGGALIADDVEWNDALAVFASEIGVEPFRWWGRRGSRGVFVKAVDA